MIHYSLIASVSIMAVQNSKVRAPVAVAPAYLCRIVTLCGKELSETVPFKPVSVFQKVKGLAAV